MKVVRITPRSPRRAKVVHLFDNAEALYVFLTEKTDPTEMDECIALTLTGDEFMEIEWLGCEFVYAEDGTHTRLDSVRLGKALPTENSSGSVVETYVGWVSDDEIMFDDGVDANAEYTRLAGHDERFIDLPHLFGDDVDVIDSGDDIPF